MADATPQLKRKGEEVAAHRKAKKQRKSDAAALRNSVQTATPATTTTPKKQSNPAPKRNGVSEDVTNGTPTTAQHGQSDATAQTLTATVNGVDEEPGVVGDVVPGKSDLLKAAETDKKKKKEKKERKEKEKEKESKKPDSWITSPVQGGWFLSTADPTFSPDEKHLIIANLRSLCIYATETSLLANTLPVDDKGVLTAYALSSTKPNRVYIADSTGQVALWDWVSGKNVARWWLRSTIVHMAVITKPESESDELMYCVDAGGKNISLRILPIKAKANEPRHSLKQILDTGSSTIRGIQVLLQGKYVVVSSDDSITVGKRVKANSKTELQDFEYVWREFKFSKRITTFNAYHREPQETGKGKKVAQDQREVIDIAVGHDSGVVLLFEDILASFAAIEKGKKGKIDTAEGLKPKRLHWHRDAVGSVKWSLDGKCH
jgi:NET1-associated nuclear protein 1 (U3 small nucleolar RNA-associated protein 17)